MKQDIIPIILVILLLGTIIYLQGEARFKMHEQIFYNEQLRDSVRTAQKENEMIGTYLMRETKQHHKEWAEFLEDLGAKGAFRAWQKRRYRARTGRQWKR